MPTPLISLGSNVGDRAATLRRALELLALVPDVRVTATSSFHETKPAGGPAAQEKFLNAAALLETDLPPRELFSSLQNVEHQLGRVRSERWGPRTIDLDLLLYDELELETPELTLPHPRMSFRRFVLEPAEEIAAEMVHPVCGNTIGGLLAHLNKTPRCILVASSIPSQIWQAFSDVAHVNVTGKILTKFRTPRDKLPEAYARWVVRNDEQVSQALAALSAQQWLVTDWWKPIEECVANCLFEQAKRQGRIREADGESVTPASDQLDSASQAFKLIVVCPSAANAGFRRILSQHYRGPSLWLSEDSSTRLRDEVLAAIEAME